MVRVGIPSSSVLLLLAAVDTSTKFPARRFLGPPNLGSANIDLVDFDSFGGESAATITSAVHGGRGALLLSGVGALGGGAGFGYRRK